MSSNRQVPSTSTAVGWLFNERLPTGHQQDPDSHLHFKSTDGAAASAIREAIQNALDASAPGQETVTVRLALAPLSHAALQEVFGEAVGHWEASGVPARCILAERGATGLVIEDFGTTGLTGSLTGTEPEDGAYPSFVFWAGASGKEEWRGGRFGLGKTALMIASRLRVMAVHTVREGEGGSVLIAKAMLKRHELDGVKYQGWGYYTTGLHRGVGPEMPFEGAEAARIGGLLGSTRNGRTGTSVIIPFPVSDITAHSGMAAALANFGHQIARGKLRVDAFGEMLESSTVQAVAARVLPPGDPAHHRIRLALSMDAGSLPRFAVNATRKSDTEVEARDVPGLLDIKAAWSAGRPFLIEATFPFDGPASGPDVVYVVEPTRGDLPLEARAPFFVRNGVSIRLAKHAPAACLHSAEIRSKRASAFFARAENPAHTAWTATDAPSYHVFTQATSLVRCIEELCAPPRDDAKVRSAFDGFFRVALPNRKRKDDAVPGQVCYDGHRAAPGRGAEPGLPTTIHAVEPGEGFVFPAPIGGRPTVGMPSFSYGYVDGSFVMRGRVPEAVARGEIVLSLGYKVNRQRKGIKKHTPHDFDLTDQVAHAIEAEGATARARGANFVVLAPTASRVSVKLRGFDPNRALDYHVSFRPLEAPANA
jgi:hypothetical protein